jgi:hypothetical protein
MKSILTCFALILTYANAFSQSVIGDINNDNIKYYYSEAIKYKDGIGVRIDYTKAFENFEAAAKLGDLQSEYAIGYLHYKGLGCTQDYTKAAKLFSNGAFHQKDNSMYFYALCFRNGYGIERNEDSARFWLTKSAALGYNQAIQELSMTDGENNNLSAQKLVESITFAALPKEQVLNQFTKIQNKQPVSELLDGLFQGYMIQYDWSGKNVIDSKKLTLELKLNNSTISGLWDEESSGKIPFIASISGDSIIFHNAKLGRKDHYSADTNISYEFKNMKLNTYQTRDIVYLIGNTEMFSNLRKEPSKPITIALSKFQINKSESVIKSVKVYPNPFVDYTNVEFEVLAKEEVEIQVVHTSGALLVSKNSGMLEKGKYAIKLELSTLVPGSYFIKIKHGQLSESYPIFKR